MIFDLDGVLVHTDRFHYLAWKALADRLGITLPNDFADRTRGVSRMASLDILLAGSARVWTSTEKEALAAEKNETYVSYIRGMTPADVDQDVGEALKQLHERDILLALGSGSKNAPLILERTGLLNAFDAVVDGGDIHRSKPDPEVFLLAAERLGVWPGDALVVEDADAGIRAAHAGGFAAVAFGGDAVNCPLADYRVRRLTELITLV